MLHASGTGSRKVVQDSVDGSRLFPLLSSISEDQLSERLRARIIVSVTRNTLKIGTN